MDKLLQRVFLVLAAVPAVFAVVLVAAFQCRATPWLTTKTFLGCVLLCLFFLAAAYRLNKEWKFRILLLVLTLALVELTLQAAAWLGVLPGVNTSLNAPYARVYCTAEGRGNGIRNGFGWYYPPFDLQATQRVVVIGDSQVQARQVPRDRNLAYLLQQLLKQASPDWAVLGLGSYGASPAYYFEVAQYAQRYFQPREAIVCVSMGTDIQESSRTLNHNLTPYVYYDLDEHGQLVIDPISVEHRAFWLQELELGERPFYWWLPTLIKSHCMTLQSWLSVRDALNRRRLAAERLALVRGAVKDATARDFAELGLDPTPFAVQQSPEVKRAMQVMERELERCKEICDRCGIQLRVVTIPVFPSVFYETQHGHDWTTRIGDYDYLGPERELAAWAAEKQIPFLSLGTLIQSKKLDVGEIRSLYFSHGTGHLTEKGHRFCADAIYEAFYKAKPQ
jgi:hypothetical protein